MVSSTADAFDQLTDTSDPPLLVVTTSAAGKRAGCVVGFHTRSGIAPERYCFWLSKANHTYRVALRATHFGLHFLTDRDLAVAEHFGTRTGEEIDKFAGVAVEHHPHGVPLLSACPHRVVVERLAMLDDGGDHVCLSAHVVTAESPGGFTPLRISAATGLAPGRQSEQRAVEP